MKQQMKPSKLKRAGTILAIMLALMVGTVAVVTATTATAEAHGANQNGCSYVPDSSYFFNFHSSCDTHDLCYTYQWYGSGYNGRLGCDQRFYNDMKSSCNTKWYKWYHGAQRATCKGFAWTYYTGVRVFGGSFFGSAVPQNVRIG